MLDLTAFSMWGIGRDVTCLEALSRKQSMRISDPQTHGISLGTRKVLYKNEWRSLHYLANQSLRRLLSKIYRENGTTNTI
jgi:hypothetical protein